MVVPDIFCVCNVLLASVDVQHLVASSKIDKSSCRTKRWMSEDSFGEPLLYLPAAVTRSIANNGAMPEGASTILFCHDVSNSLWVSWFSGMTCPHAKIYCRIILCVMVILQLGNPYLIPGTQCEYMLSISDCFACFAVWQLLVMIESRMPKSTRTI